MNFHTGLRYQRGRGFGNLFSGLIRGFAPLARLGLSAGRKLLGSDLVKNVASTAMESGKQALKSLAADMLEGKDITNTANEELSEARKKIASTIRGSGKSRKRKRPTKGILKKKRVKYNLLDDYE